MFYRVNAGGSVKPIHGPKYETLLYGCAVYKNSLYNQTDEVLATQFIRKHG